jgi:hypothetical protein
MVSATICIENNMIKRNKVCMASGGVYPQEREKKAAEVPEWQKSLKTAWDAITGNESPTNDRPKERRALIGPRDAIVDRKKKNRDALNYARGGVAGVIPVKGKGTATSDSIPVVVAGQEFGLSDGEGIATLPAKTMKTPGAIDAIESIIQATNDGKPPVPTKAGGRAAGGVDDLEKKKVVPAGDQGAIKRDGNSFSMAPAPVSGQQATDPNRYPYTGQPAPTAQEVYAPVDIGGMARAAFPATSAAIQEGGANMRKAYDEGNYGAVLGHAGREIVSGGAGLLSDIGNSAAYALNPPANALKTFVTGDSAPARKPEPAGIASGLPKTPVYSAAADDKMGVPNYPVPQADPTIARNTGNAGDARHNPATGMLSFTDPNFDVSQQQNSAKFADGRSIVLTGQGIDGGLPSAGAQAGGNVDAHGNNMALTQGYQRQLNNQRAEQARVDARNAVPAGPSYAEQQRAKADRFTQFVNESDTARLAHDLGTGGGTAKTNAGRIAALNDMRERDAGVRNNLTARANEATRAQGRIDEAGIEGQSRMAGIDALGDNQISVEQLRQQSPAAQAQVAAAQLQQQQTRGSITDADQIRKARMGIAAAYQSGDPKRIEAANQQGIAYGVTKPAEPPEYKTTASPLGGFASIDSRTGAGRVVDASGAETSLSAIGSSAAQVPPPEASRKIGQIYPTPSGPHRWTKSGWEPVNAG